MTADRGGGGRAPVHRVVVAALQHQLRRQVVRRAAQRVGAPGAHLLGEPKVRHLEVAVLGNQQVLRLEVPVKVGATHTPVTASSWSPLTAPCRWNMNPMTPACNDSSVSNCELIVIILINDINSRPKQAPAASSVVVPVLTGHRVTAGLSRKGVLVQLCTLDITETRAGGVIYVGSDTVRCCFALG